MPAARSERWRGCRSESRGNCNRLAQPAVIDPAEVVAKPLTIIGDDPRVDLLTLAWSVRYADAAPHVLRAQIEGVEIPFADLDSLIRSKQTGRLQDKADVEALERVKQISQGGA